MSDHSLLCHPICPSLAVSGVDASARFAADGSLILGYRIRAGLAELRLPAPCLPAAADNLWQHTCCEAFVASVRPADPSYREFNFSPSGQWAAYGFKSYRDRDPGFRPAATPAIILQPLADGCQLTAAVPPELLPAGDAWQLGLSCVIEAADGDKSYWALAHTAGQPDFHQRQSFTLNLTRPTP